MLFQDASEKPLAKPPVYSTNACLRWHLLPSYRVKKVTCFLRVKGDMFSPVFFEPETFKNLFLMLGPFHWAKVLLHFAGPLCAGFGIEDSLMDCEVFGPIVLNSVMSRGHCLVNDWYSHDRGRHVQIGVGGTLAPVQWRWKKRWDSRRRRKIQKNLRCYLRISKMLMLIMLSLLSKLNASHVWRFDNIWMRD